MRTALLALVALAAIATPAVILLARDDGDDGDAGAPASPAPPTAPRARCDLVAAPGGDDSADGSRARPLRTPGALAARLGPGQDGCLRAGTYTETEVTIATDRVTLRGFPGEAALWRGRIIVEGDGVTIEGLGLDGSAGTPCDEGSCAGGVLPSPTITGSDVTIRGNDVTSPDAGICVHPVAAEGRVPDRVLIERNRIHDCGRRPPTEHDHGVYVAAGRGAVIRDNVVYDNADRGIQLYPSPVGARVEGNTVDGNGSGIIISELTSGAVIRDNVFSGSVRRWNAESDDLSGAGNVFARNCVHPSGPIAGFSAKGGVSLPASVTQRGNTTGDPGYRDSGGGDFRLAPGSPCAGRGAPAAVAAPPAAG